jgi:hypothetical protein
MKEKNTEKYKDLVIMNIRTFGTNGRRVKASEIYEKSDKSMRLDLFQRVVTHIVEEFQLAEAEKMERGEDYVLILSYSNGYGIPSDDNEAQEGIVFYSERIMPIFKRRKLLKRMAQRKFQQKMVYYKKDVSTVKQESLF